ncbi:hypothetical protein QP168_00355 [Aerococcus urinae]|uniref:Uncharacterized protein n=3 Tax=Aerococcus TaxID=1375 RepID=A0A1E9PHB0_9LACT|nr:MULTISPECIES: hypothetical protein [Aerococcus]MCY3034026.1 hypothetical protein [Aerococcus mictus]MCY3065794.1 hypothetical protein [Aerococcus mictus]MCY3066450.1 hypothetical protein [Aerococcus mictus]MCY3071375.1 hypothetical protein [Aerococcus mictus]MCY3071791.1 hypothetical protein [Aerococcus mictus]
MKNQIETYQKYFTYVGILTGNKNLESIVKKYKNSSIGIYTKEKCIQKEKYNDSHLNSYAQYQILRKEERHKLYRQIIQEPILYSQFTEYENVFKDLDIHLNKKEWSKILNTFLIERYRKIIR